MATDSRRSWRLAGLLALLPAGLGTLVLLRYGPGTAGFASALRWTARCSFAFFVIAFTSSALAARWPAPATRWLLSRRRAFGVAFALSHACHGTFILWRNHHDTSRLLGDGPLAQLVPGMLVFLLIAAMLATSFDRAVVLLGPRRWRRLHLVGGYSIFSAFALAYGTRLAGGSLIDIAPVAILVAVVGLRLTTRRSGPSRIRVSST